MSDRPASLIGPRFLVASLLLHAAVLLLLPAKSEMPRPLQALNVQLAVPAATSPTPRHETSSSPTANPRSGHLTLPAPPALARASLPAARASPVQLATASDEPPPVTLDPTPAAAIPTAVATTTVAATALAAEPRERRGKPSTLWLAEYTQQLSGQVGRQKQYPQIARLRGWQGTAIVAIQLSAEGLIVATTIAQSTGHDVLDQQALTMIRHAGPLPPLPNAIAGEALTVQLPIVFTLAAKD